MIYINTLSRKKLSMLSGLLVGLSYPPGLGVIALFGFVPILIRGLGISAVIGLNLRPLPPHNIAIDALSLII